MYMYLAICGNVRSLAVVSFNQPGTFMLTGADDGHVFVVDARCTENFKCLGFVGESSYKTAAMSHIRIHVHVCARGGHKLYNMMIYMDVIRFERGCVRESIVEVLLYL